LRGQVAVHSLFAAGCVLDNAPKIARRPAFVEDFQPVWPSAVQLTTSSKRVVRWAHVDRCGQESGVHPASD